MVAKKSKSKLSFYHKMVRTGLIVLAAAATASANSSLQHVQAQETVDDVLQGLFGAGLATAASESTKDIEKAVVEEVGGVATPSAETTPKVMVEEEQPTEGDEKAGVVEAHASQPQRVHSLGDLLGSLFGQSVKHGHGESREQEAKPQGEEADDQQEIPRIVIDLRPAHAQMAAARDEHAEREQEQEERQERPSSLMEALFGGMGGLRSRRAVPEPQEQRQRQSTGGMQMMSLSSTMGGMGSSSMSSSESTDPATGVTTQTVTREVSNADGSVETTTTTKQMDKNGQLTSESRSSRTSRGSGSSGSGSDGHSGMMSRGSNGMLQSLFSSAESRDLATEGKEEDEQHVGPFRRQGGSSMKMFPLSHSFASDMSYSLGDAIDRFLCFCWVKDVADKNPSYITNLLGLARKGELELDPELLAELEKVEKDLPKKVREQEAASQRAGGFEELETQKTRYALNLATGELTKVLDAAAETPKLVLTESSKASEEKKSSSSSSQAVTTSQASAPAADDKVSLKVYGEAGCINTNDFVVKVLEPLASDSQLMSGVTYDFVAFGNAYYPTAKCGPTFRTLEDEEKFHSGKDVHFGKDGDKKITADKRRVDTEANDGLIEYEANAVVGAYDVKERMCWQDMCLASADPPADCFLQSNGLPKKAIYQHGAKEGQVDRYHNCVKETVIRNSESDYELMMNRYTFCMFQRYDQFKTAQQLMVKCMVEAAPTKHTNAVLDCYSKDGAVSSLVTCMY